MTEMPEVYNLKEPQALAQFLKDADIRLVRAEYLMKLLKEKHPLKRRQEAEAASEFCSDLNHGIRSALVRHEEVHEWAHGRKDAMIFSVSHAWETREHPDPCRFQLQQIVNCIGLYGAAYYADIWVFYDYMSLFQFKRQSAAQEDSFKRSMGDMHVLYAHEFTRTLRIQSLTPEDVWNRMLESKEGVPVFHEGSGDVKALPLRDLVANATPYEERGWCLAEIEWSSARSDSSLHQRIDPSEVSNTEESLKGRVTTHPVHFKTKMAKAAFTHRSDAESVLHLQQKIFYEKVTACEELRLSQLPPNQIMALAASLEQYSALKVLRLLDFECSDAETEKFAEALTRHKTVVEVEFAPRSRKSALAMVKALAEALKQNSSVTTIDLEGNYVGAPGAKALAEALTQNSFVTTIDLKNNDIGPPGAKALAEALKQNSSVTTINLKHNLIRDEGAKALAEALKQNSSVTTIDLELISFDGVQALTEIAEFVARNKAAQVAEAEVKSKPSLQDAFSVSKRMEALAEALEQNSSVTTINLQCNGIGAQGAKALAEALKQNSSVTTIDLQGNYFEDEGAKALAEALKQNSSVTTINLERNGIRDEGAKALAEALTQNSFVTTIDLDGNYIGAEGKKALAKALKQNSCTGCVTLLCG